MPGLEDFGYITGSNMEYSESHFSQGYTVIYPRSRLRQGLLPESTIVQSQEQYGRWFKSQISTTVHFETIPILDEETTISFLA